MTIENRLLVTILMAGMTALLYWYGREQFREYRQVKKDRDSDYPGRYNRRYYLTGAMTEGIVTYILAVGLGICTLLFMTGVIDL
jgi:hypothetical protein